MQKLFSNRDKKLLMQVDKLEKELQQFTCDNWGNLFPEYTFIDQNFHLNGNVHRLGAKGSIDILAYHTDKKRFAIFELKKDHHNGMSQAVNYSYFVQYNFADVYAQAKNKIGDVLPQMAEEVEIVLIAKSFTKEQIFRAEKSNERFTLIAYNWFENNLLLIDYVHTPDMKKKTVKQAGKKPQKWQQYPDKIWARLQQATKTREENVKKLSGGNKRRKRQEDFVRFAYECIAAKNAQTLYDRATQENRPFYIEKAKMILDLEQNAHDTNDKGTE